MIRRILISFSTLAVTAGAVYGQGLSNLKLNEIVVENPHGLVDEYGDRSGWIEIANTSWTSTNVSGCYLTNNPAVLDPNLSASERIAKMSQIPRGDDRTNISPKGHLVIYTDGRINLGTLHANFVLTPGKANFIALFEANGTKLLDSITVPATLPAGYSWSRFGDGKNKAQWVACDSAHVTPHAANDNTQQKEDKVAEFKEKDPHGFAMTILGMGIVLGGLLLLCLFFMLFGYVARALSSRNQAKRNALVDAKVAPPVAPKPVAPKQAKTADEKVVIAVIGMALYELEQDAHDYESGVITIARTASPWPSRALEITKRSKI